MIKRILVLFVSIIMLICAPLTACQKPEQTGDGDTITGSIFSGYSDTKIDLYDTKPLEVNEGLNGEIVEWQSSDSSVVLMENGMAIALKTGSATVTAKYGGVTQEQKFTVVNNGLAPQIVVSDVTVVKGQKVVPTIKTTFKDAEMVGVTYTFESANMSVVAVENQKLSALTEGASKITVNAVWRGLTVAQATFNCAVSENNGVVLNRHEFNLYIVDNVRGEAYEKQIDVTANVYEQGVIVPDTVVVWESGNTAVATITEKGNLTAVSVGETYIQGTCSYGGKTIKTAKIPVTVEVPVLETEINLVVDLNKTYEIPDAGQILNVGDHDIGKIIDADTGRVYAENGDSLVTNQFAPGEYNAIVYNGTGEYGVKLNLVAAEYIIDSVDDVKTINALENRNKYMVLTKDIDFEGQEYKNVDNAHTGTKGNANYFTGTLNGLGYSIKNIKIGSFISGLFTGSKGSTIKNLGMTVTLTRANSAAFFYWFRESPTTIDNVYLDVKVVGDPATAVDKGKWPANTGAGVIATHGLNASINMTNCFFRVENHGAQSLNTACGAVMAYAAYGSAIYNACYIISPDFKLVGQTSNSNNRFESEYNMTPNVLYDSDEAFILAKNRANSPINLEGFNSYWDLSGDVPIFKSAK